MAAGPISENPNSTALREDQASQFVARQLDRARWQVRLVEISGSLMTLVVMLLGFFLVLAIIDAWVWELGWFTRNVAFGTLFLGGLFYFVRTVLPLLRRQINPMYAAKMIEEVQPSFKNSLLNFLSFREDPSAAQLPIMQAIGSKAANDLSKIEIESAIDRAKLIRVGYVLAGVLAACAAYKIFSPKDPLTTVYRVVAPLADVQAPAVVRIQSVTPGDAEIFFGETLKIEVETVGLGAKESPTIRFTSVDQQIVNQPLPMERVGEIESFVATLTTNGTDIRQELDYYIEAGDARSATYHVKVRSLPTVALEKVTVTPPAYTELPSRELIGQGDVESIEGTMVKIEASTNVTLKSAQLDLLVAPKGDATAKSGNANTVAPSLAEIDRWGTAKSIPLQVDGTKLIGEFLLEMQNDRVTSKYDGYRIKVTSDRGEVNKTPPTFRIRTYPDLAPEVSIVKPTQKETDVDIKSKLPIEVKAIDRDFQVAQVRIRIERQGQKLVQETLLDSGRTHDDQVTDKYSFIPEKLDLKAGDVVVFFAEAEDNRQAPGKGLPDPNISRTENYTIRITDDQRGENGPNGQNGQNGENNGNQGSSDQNQNQNGQSDQPNNGQSGGNSGGMNNPMSGNQQNPNGNQGNENPNQQNKPNGNQGGNNQPQPQNGQNSQQNQGDEQQGNMGGGSNSGMGEQNAGNSGKQQGGTKPSESQGSGNSSSQGAQDSGGKGQDGTGDGQSGNSGANGNQPTGSNNTEAQPSSGSNNSAGNNTQGGMEKASDGSNQNGGNSGSAQTRPEGAQTTGSKNSSNQNNKSANGNQGSDPQSGGMNPESGNQSPNGNSAGNMNPTGSPMNQNQNQNPSSNSNQNPMSGNSPNSNQNSQNGPQSGSQSPSGQQSPNGNPDQNGGNQQDGSGGQAEQPSPMENQQGGGAGDQNQQQSGGTGGEKDPQGGAQSGNEDKGGGQGDGHEGSAIEKILDHMKNRSGKGKSGNPNSTQSNPESNANGQNGENGETGTGNGQGENRNQQDPAAKKSSGGGESNPQSGNSGKQTEDNQGSGKQRGAGNDNQPKGSSDNEKSAGENGNQPMNSERNPNESENSGAGSNSTEQNSKGGNRNPSEAEPSKNGSEASGENSSDENTSGENQGAGSENKSANGGASEESSSKNTPDESSAANGEQNGEKGNSEQRGDEEGAKSNSQNPEASGSNSDKNSSEKSDGKSENESGKQGSTSDTTSDGDTGSESSKDSNSKTESENKKGANSKSGGSSKGNAKSTGNNQSAGKKGSDRNQPGDGNATAGPSTPNPALGDGDLPDGEKANLEYAKKATDLALEYLKDQQNKPDDELLKDLNWTPEQMREFIKRWESMKEKAKQGSAADQRKLDERLRSLGLRPQDGAKRTEVIGDDQVNGLSQDGVRSVPPPEFAEKFKSFLKGTARKQNSKGEASGESAVEPQVK